MKEKKQASEEAEEGPGWSIILKLMLIILL